MATIKVYAQGIEGATVTAESSETGYDISNVKLRTRRNSWKSTSTAETWIKIDFGTATLTDYVYLDKSNFGDTILGEIEWQRSSNGSSWTTIAALAGTDSGQIYTYTPATYRYYRLILSPDTAFATARELKFLLTGSLISLTGINPSPGAGQTNNSLKLITHEALNGNRSSLRITQLDSNTTRKTFTRSFLNISSTELGYISQIYTDSANRLYPFPMTDYDGTLRLVRLMNDLNLSQDRYNVYNVPQLTMEEEL